MPRAQKRHYRRHPGDLTNQKFGRLTVLAVDPTRRGFCLCRCDCGRQLSLRRGALTSGNTRSCGCLRSDRASQNGAMVIHKNTEVFRAENAKHCTNFGIITKDAPNRNNRSGHKGVWYDPVRHNWQAYISVHRKRHALGAFSTFDEAVEARERAEERYFAPLIRAFQIDMDEVGETK